MPEPPDADDGPPADRQACQGRRPSHLGDRAILTTTALPLISVNGACSLPCRAVLRWETSPTLGRRASGVLGTGHESRKSAVLARYGWIVIASAFDAENAGALLLAAG